MKKQQFGCQLSVEQLQYLRAASIKTNKSINQLTSIAISLLQTQYPLEQEQISAILRGKIYGKAPNYMEKKISRDFEELLNL